MPEEPCNKCGQRTGLLRATGKLFCYSCQDCNDLLNRMRKYKQNKTGEEYKRMEEEKKAIRDHTGGAAAYNKAQALVSKRKSTGDSGGSATVTSGKAVARHTPAEEEEGSTRKSSARKRQKNQSNVAPEEAQQGTGSTNAKAVKAREESKTILEMSRQFVEFLGSHMALGTSELQESINLNVLFNFMRSYMDGTGASGMSIAQMLTASNQQRYMNSASHDQRVKASTFLKWFGQFSESLDEFSSQAQLSRMARGARKKASQQQAINRRSADNKAKEKEWMDIDVDQLRAKMLDGSMKDFAALTPQMKSLCSGAVKYQNSGLTAKQRHEVAAHPVVLFNVLLKPMRGCVATSLTILQFQQLCEGEVVIVEQQKASVKDKYVPLVASSEQFSPTMRAWFKHGRPTLLRQGLSSQDPIVVGAMAIRPTDVDSAWKFMHQRKPAYDILLQEHEMYKRTGNPSRLTMFMHLHGAKLEFNQKFIDQQAKKNKGKGEVELKPTAQQLQIAMNWHKNEAVFLTHNGDPANGGSFGVMLGKVSKKHCGTMIKPIKFRTLVTHKARKEGNVEMKIIDRACEHTPEVSAKFYNPTDSEQQNQQAREFADYYKFSGPSNNMKAKQVRASAKPVTYVRAPAKQTVYHEDKAHCAKPGCGGEGLQPCNACKQARYCGRACQVAHWAAHEADCKRVKKAKMIKGR
jgi:hypothetical protein